MESTDERRRMLGYGLFTGMLLYASVLKSHGEVSGTWGLQAYEEQNCSGLSVEREFRERERI